MVRVSSVGLNPTDWKHVGNNMLLGIIGCQGMGPENLNEDRPSSIVSIVSNPHV